MLESVADSKTDGSSRFEAQDKYARHTQLRCEITSRYGVNQDRVSFSSTFTQIPTDTACAWQQPLSPSSSSSEAQGLRQGCSLLSKQIKLLAACGSLAALRRHPLWIIIVVVAMLHHLGEEVRR